MRLSYSSSTDFFTLPLLYSVNSHGPAEVNQRFQCEKQAVYHANNVIRTQINLHYILTAKTIISGLLAYNRHLPNVCGLFVTLNNYCYHLPHSWKSFSHCLGIASTQRNVTVTPTLVTWPPNPDISASSRIPTQSTTPSSSDNGVILHIAARCPVLYLRNDIRRLGGLTAQLSRSQPKGDHDIGCRRTYRTP